MIKTLDQKLARIHADPSCKDFILADAKDADMAGGLAAPGTDPGKKEYRTLAEYRQLMRDVLQQGLVDILLMSVSSSEILTLREKRFENSAITPAIRANDTTDIHLAQGGQYPRQPSRPFRTAHLDHAQCGKLACEPGERKLGANLGLYSITFNNDIALDLPALEAYKIFRLEAEAKGFRHFLEIFDPNACGQHCPADLGRFINDQIVRTLAGVPSSGRPIFLKIPYHGPKAMEDLVRYDPHLVPGILGGSSGTTFDAFHMLWEAKKSGARAALYGRKINNSEHQLTFIRFLRMLADGQIAPAEAVKAYHGELQKLKIKPYRALEDDLKQTENVSSYGGVSAVVKGLKVVSNANGTKPRSDQPDFAKMTPAQKIAWNRAKWKRVFD
jgi:hypothetical protein